MVGRSNELALTRSIRRPVRLPDGSRSRLYGDRRLRAGPTPSPASASCRPRQRAPPASGRGRRRARRGRLSRCAIALFITCYNDLLFPEVGQAMVRLLRRLGHEVEFPADQTCCGQMHFNSGYQDACIPLVDRFVDAFAGYDVVVTPSGSCAAMVRHHHAVVAELPAPGDLADRVADVAPRVLELSEFLVDTSA